MKKGQKLHQATNLAQQLKARQNNQRNFKQQKATIRTSAIRPSNKYKQDDAFPYREILVLIYRVLKKIAQKIFR